MVTIQNYVRAQSIDEAYELNQKKGSCIIGGMLWTKMQDRLIQTAIDMCDLGLDKIEEREDEFIIGAMTSLRQIELHDGLNKYTHGAVCEAVKDIVGVQFRNLATIGGSIWGRFGFSDILTVFLAMDAFVELYHGGMIPLREFVNMKQDRDVIVHLIIRKTPGVFAYASVRNPDAHLRAGAGHPQSPGDFAATTAGASRIRVWLRGRRIHRGRYRARGRLPQWRRKRGTNRAAGAGQP